jgi:hypothetical protein
MLSSSCEFDRHIIMLSSCEFDRHIILISSSLWVRHAMDHLVSSTDTSSWYHHLVSSACYGSSCEFDRNIIMISLSCESSCEFGQWTDTSWWYHHLVIVCSPLSPQWLPIDCQTIDNVSLPKRRFWKDEQKMQSGLSMDFFEGPWPKSSTHVLEKCFLRNPDWYIVMLLSSCDFKQTHHHDISLWKSSTGPQTRQTPLNTPFNTAWYDAMWVGLDTAWCDAL